LSRWNYHFIENSLSAWTLRKYHEIRAEPEVSNWSRKEVARSREKKRKKSLDNSGRDSREHCEPARYSLFELGIPKWGDTARPRLCGLRALVARSRPQRRGAPRRASLAAASRSIDRSLDQCRFDRVEVHPTSREESRVTRENFSRLEYRKLYGIAFKSRGNSTISFFILASFQSIVWGVLVISLWGYRSVSRSRYVHQFYLHVWVDQMSCTDVFNRFLEGVFVKFMIDEVSDKDNYSEWDQICFE